MKRVIFSTLGLVLGLSVLAGCNNNEQKQLTEETQLTKVTDSISNDYANVPGLNVKDGVATFTQNATIGAKYKVPGDWKKIIIKDKVTLKGNFLIATHNSSIEIAGEGWESVLDNSITPYKKGGPNRDYCNIRYTCNDKKAVLKLSNFVSKNPANFHITSWAPVEIHKMKIIDTRGQPSTDGVHSTHGAKIYDSFISTYDDALYVGETSWIENTTIEHNSNGGPLQVSWGGNANGNSMTVKDCKFIDTANKYNQGVVGWAKKEGGGKETVTIKFVGNNTWTVKNGAKKSPFYTFSSGDNGAVKNAVVVQDGGDKDWAKSIEQRNGSNGVVNVK